MRSFFYYSIKNRPLFQKENACPPSLYRQEDRHKFLFNGFKRLHHFYFFQRKMHHKLYNGCESNGKKKGV